MSISLRMLLLGVASLALVLALVACDSSSEPSQAEKTAQMNDLVKGWDFGGGMGAPDKADCTPAGDNYTCTVDFGPKTLEVVTVVRKDGHTVDLKLSADQVALCKDATVDANLLKKFAAGPIAANEKLTAFGQNGGADPAQLRVLATSALDAYRVYLAKVDAFQPQSEWGQDAAPTIRSAAREAVQAMDDLFAGRTTAAAASTTIAKGSDAVDAVMAAIPCPTTTDG